VPVAAIEAGAVVAITGETPEEERELSTIIVPAGTPGLTVCKPDAVKGRRTLIARELGLG